MRNVSGGFNGKKKFFWNGISPSFKGFFLRKTIKGIVDFYGIEQSCIVRKVFGRGEFFRIKNSFPMIVMPAGRSDIMHKKPLFEALPEKRGGCKDYFFTFRISAGFFFIIDEIEATMDPTSDKFEGMIIVLFSFAK